MSAVTSQKHLLCRITSHIWFGLIPHMWCQVSQVPCDQFNRKTLSLTDTTTECTEWSQYSQQLIILTWTFPSTEWWKSNTNKLQQLLLFSRAFTRCKCSWTSCCLLPSVPGQPAGWPGWVAWVAWLASSHYIITMCCWKASSSYSQSHTRQQLLCLNWVHQ